MRALDRLFVRELTGPWAFGVAMFTTLLFAGTFLGRVTGFLADGLPLGIVVKASLLYLPAILAKTFPMAMLLAALLGYGRLSNDSEITAVRAAGASVPRIVMPATGFAFAVALLAFAVNEVVVPPATRASLGLANEIVAMQRPSERFPIVQKQIEDGKLRLGIIASNFRPLENAFEGVTLVGYDDEGKESSLLLAKRVRFVSPGDWRIEGGGTLLTPDGLTVMKITGDVWPEGVPRITTSLTDLVKERDDDFDAETFAGLAAKIADFKRNRSRTNAQIANYEYGLWNKIAVPLAAVVFGTLGGVLGIRNARSGTASGFALAIAIIFGYFMLSNLMAVWAQGGRIPAWTASFAPIVVGLAASGFLIWRKNQ